MVTRTAVLSEVAFSLIRSSDSFVWPAVSWLRRYNASVSYVCQHWDRISTSVPLKWAYQLNNCSKLRSQDLGAIGEPTDLIQKDFECAI